MILGGVCLVPALYCSGADSYRARDFRTLGATLQQLSARALSSALAPFAARARDLYHEPAARFFLRMRRSEVGGVGVVLCWVFLRGLIGTRLWMRGGGTGCPHAACGSAFFFFFFLPERISACLSEHDRRLVQMPMSDFAESEQR